jgi:hypothetical protein
MVSLPAPFRINIIDMEDPIIQVTTHLSLADIARLLAHEEPLDVEGDLRADSKRQQAYLRVLGNEALDLYVETAKQVVAQVRVMHDEVEFDPSTGYFRADAMITRVFGGLPRASPS